MKKKEQPATDSVVTETKVFMRYLANRDVYNGFDFSQRQEDILKMKWNYGLTFKQIAEKVKLKEATVKGTYDTMVYQIFRHIKDLIVENPEREILKEQIQLLVYENNRYKRKFEALSRKKKNQFAELDITIKTIGEVGFSHSTELALHLCKIYTVEQLLQYRPASLLLFSYLSVENVEEVEEFVRKNHLRMNS